ncbi:LuxR C-terminal-related transcriptional regulator [Streptomyces sp. NPDC051453]|uniref:LuxR C-terminal-related transcriptional regulator n=1 Tax=Streptomyces sp. NPDC051453 TaxID=3154941 RepID=UPI003446DE21
MTRGPARMALTPRQAEVLAAAASGDSLTVIAARVGTNRPQVAARLAEAYQRLEVTHLPRDGRRAAAVRAARHRGLIPLATWDGPSVAEATASDRRWPLEKEGE